MHIGLIIYGDLRTISGGFLYDRQLVAYLRSCGDDVDVLPLPWRSYPLSLLQNTALGFAGRLLQGGYDLLLQDELNHPSLVLLNRLLRWRGGPPSVSIVHHLRTSEHHSAALLPLYRTIERAYLRGVDGMIFSSAATCAATTALSGQPRRFLIAHPGADPFDPADTSSPAKQLPAPGKPFKLLCVGTVCARKGGHTLLEALALLEGNTCTLTFAGSLEDEPRYVARLRRLSVQLGLQEQVRFSGNCSNREIRRLYAESDIFVMPSQHEGFGIVYLEAMAFGLPVIGSSSGGASEIIQNGINGFLIEPGDAAQLAICLKQLTGPAVYTGFSAAAQQRWREHPCWADTMKRVRETLLAWLDLRD